MPTSTERQMERLRPAQFRALREEMPLAYLPLGILEWHGPQNPLGLDGVKAHALCCRSADRTGGIVFPTLYYSSPPSSLYLDVDLYDPAISDTYNLPPDYHTTDKFGFGDRLEQWRLFARVLDQTFRQIARYGFEAIFALAGHYPLAHERNVAMNFEYEFGVPIWLDHEGKTFEPADGDHAAQWETSLTMALEPDTVDPGAFPKAGDPNPPGVYGKPVADITQELAQANLQRTLDGMAESVERLLERRKSLAARRREGQA